MIGVDGCPCCPWLRRSVAQWAGVLGGGAGLGLGSLCSQRSARGLPRSTMSGRFRSFTVWESFEKRTTVGVCGKREPHVPHASVVKITALFVNGLLELNRTVKVIQRRSIAPLQVGHELAVDDIDAARQRRIAAVPKGFEWTRDWRNPSGFQDRTGGGAVPRLGERVFRITHRD